MQHVSKVAVPLLTAITAIVSFICFYVHGG
jgi:hypothetical protein